MRVSKIVEGALKQLGVIGAGETISPDVLNDSLDVFKRLLDEWETENLLQFNRQIITLPAGKNVITFGSDIQENIANVNEIVINKIYNKNGKVLQKASSLAEVTKDVQMGEPTKYVYLYTGGALKIFLDKIPQNTLYAEISYLTNSIYIRNPESPYLKFIQTQTLDVEATAKGGYIFTLPTGDLLYAYQYSDSANVYTEVKKYFNGSWKDVFLYTQTDNGADFNVIISYEPNCDKTYLMIVYSTAVAVFISSDYGETWSSAGTYGGWVINKIFYGSIIDMGGGVIYTVYPNIHDDGNFYLNYLVNGNCSSWGQYAKRIFSSLGVITGVWVFNIDDDNHTKLGMIFLEDGQLKYAYTDNFTVDDNWSNPVVIDDNAEGLFLSGIKANNLLYWAYNNDSGLYVNVTDTSLNNYLSTTLEYEHTNLHGITFADDNLLFNLSDINSNWLYSQYEIVNSENLIKSYSENITSIFDLQPESDLQIPPGWYSALVLNLAVELAPLFGVAVNNLLYRRARESKLKIKQNRGMSVPLMRIDL